MTEYAICALEDIPDGEARGFDIDALDGFVVRRGTRVYGYVNICPHAGSRLDWKPDAFLTRDKSLIMCAVHGAVFEIDSGYCIGGPCQGFRLDKLDARVENGQVIVRDNNAED